MAAGRTWNVTKKLVDETIRRRRLLIGVENQVVRDVATVFRDVERDLARVIVDYLGSHDPDTWLTGARRARLLGLLQKELNANYPRLQRTVDGALKEVAKAEADLIGDRLAVATGQLPEEIPVFRPSTEQLEALARNTWPKDLGEGVRQVAESMNDLTPAAQARLKRALMDGVLRGDGTAKIASAVKAATDVSMREAIVYARTRVQQVANDAARLAYARNDHLVKGVQWMATLDKRTCLQCAAQDGKVFPNGEEPPLPAHPQCRCFYGPVVKSWRELGIPADKANADIRRMFDGKPAERETYGSWLREQPAETQRAILGASRYDAYRKDGAALDDFATDRRVLTVTEWKERAA